MKIVSITSIINLIENFSVQSKGIHKPFFYHRENREDSEETELVFSSVISADSLRPLWLISVVVKRNFFPTYAQGHPNSS